MDICSICFDSFPNIVSLTCKCNIKYCLTCIITWFNECKEEHCPICKKEVDIYGDNIDTVYKNDIKRGYSIEKISNGYNFINLDLNNVLYVKCNNILKFTDTIYYIQIINDSDIIQDIIIDFLKNIYFDVLYRDFIEDCTFSDIKFYRLLNRTYDIINIENEICIRLLNIEFNGIQKTIIPHFEFVYY
jgi:hypothetical protein